MLANCRSALASVTRLLRLNASHSNFTCRWTTTFSEYIGVSVCVYPHICVCQQVIHSRVEPLFFVIYLVAAGPAYARQRYNNNSTNTSWKVDERISETTVDMDFHFSEDTTTTSTHTGWCRSTLPVGHVLSVDSFSTLYCTPSINYVFVAVSFFISRDVRKQKHPCFPSVSPTLSTLCTR